MKKLAKKLRTIINNVDIESLDIYYQQFLINGSKKEKKLLSEAYLSIFETLNADFHYGRLNDEEIGNLMIAWVEKAEELNPEANDCNTYYGSAYRILSSLTKTQTKKEYYNEKAIGYYKAQSAKTPNNSDSYIESAYCILEKMKLTEQYKKKYFEEILSLFHCSYKMEMKLDAESRWYNRRIISAFIHITYAILFLAFKDNIKIHEIYLSDFNKLMKKAVRQEKFLYYYWAHELEHIIDFIKYQQKEDSKKNEIIGKIKLDIKDKLSKIKDYQSNDKDKFNVLGCIFENTAKDNSSLDYYQIALNYYIKAMEIDNASCWCYPVYATNVLKEMALLYIKQKELIKAKEAFKQGILIFSKSEKSIGENFTLSSYYGRYLLNYSKYIFNYHEKELLKQAQIKFEIAKRLGENSFDGPFIGLAKAALKLGDKKKCITIIQECINVFSNENYSYDITYLLKDEDFNDILSELKNM